MWNYTFVLPSTMVLTILLIYYFARPRLPIRMNRTFLGVLVTDILTVLADFSSSMMDEHYQMFSIPLLTAANMAFFVMFLLRIYYFHLFALDEMGIFNRLSKPLSTVLRSVVTVCIVITLSSVFNRAVFWIDDTGYHSGKLYNLLYFCFFFYIFASVGLILHRRKQLQKREMAGLLGYQMILLIGNVARILFPRYLIMNTFSLLAIVVIYLSFENPDLYLSDRRNAFNVKALRDILNEYCGKRKFRILGVVLCNYNDERAIYGGPQMDQGIGMICHHIATTYKDCLVFYIRGGRFIILGNANMNCLVMRRELIGRFTGPWKADGADLYLTPAFVQTTPEDCSAGQEKIVNALTVALDAAGKSVVIQEPDDELPSIREVDREMEIKINLERALETDRLEIFLQPLYDSREKRAVAAEVLCRLRDEQGRIIPPGAFIPVAEQNGYINVLGEQVFRKACLFVKEHDMEELGISWLNVNLSPIQCMRSDLSRRFEDILAENHVDSRYIHLEITEQSMVDFSSSIKQIMKLKDAGFKFALDDYGSGYSNLTRVKEYPFINIKLDMSVVWDYYHERDFLIPYLVEAFHQMNFSITAEGIETLDMAEVMSGIGCDFLQGYYFSKPLPEEEFIRYCRKEKAAAAKNGMTGTTERIRENS